VRIYFTITPHNKPATLATQSSHFLTDTPASLTPFPIDLTNWLAAQQRKTLLKLTKDLSVSDLGFVVALLLKGWEAALGFLLSNSIAKAPTITLQP